MNNKLNDLLAQSSTVSTSKSSSIGSSGYSSNTYIGGGFTHQINTNQWPNVSDTVYASSYDTNYLLRKELEETKTNFNFLMKFLMMKGIIKDEQEFKDFIDAMKLADKLAEKSQDRIVGFMSVMDKMKLDSLK